MLVGALAVAQDRLARAESDIGMKVDKEVYSADKNTHAQGHVIVDLKIKHIEEAVQEVKDSNEKAISRIESLNYQQGLKQEAQLAKILKTLAEQAGQPHTGAHTR